MKKYEKYLVIGNPIGHSRSPGMQNAAFRHWGLPEHYAALLVEPEHLGEFIARARREVRGVNLTVPFKQQVLSCFTSEDTLDISAQLCGSVNTLKIVDGHLHGYSTDGYGLEKALQLALGQPIVGQRFVFLGAGGAARATSFHLASCGAKSIFIANRTPEKATQLAADIAKNFPQCQLQSAALTDEVLLRPALQAADVLIQATALGLPGQDQLPVPEHFLADFHGVIFDTVYRKTALQRYAQEHRLPCADGKEMLIYQGARSFELWTGRKAPIEAMRRGFEAPQNPEDWL